MKFNTSIDLLAAITIILFTGCSEMMSQNKAMGSPDLTFIMNAASIQQDEIEAGKLALEKTSNPDVKEFAHMMITDHSKAYERLKKLGSVRDLTVPDVPDPTHAMMADQLKAYANPTFEKQYMANQISDHSMVLELFKATYNETQDPVLKQFLALQIPSVEQHLQYARQISDKLVS